MQVLQFFKENYILIIAILTFIEFLLRVIPTYKNYSIIEFTKIIMIELHKLFDYIIPNKIVKK
jgi:hypothetical protein